MEIEAKVENAARTLLRPITLVFVVFLVLFWTVNLGSLWWLTADAFQRLGSLWVAVLVLVFGYSRLMMSALKSLADEPRDIGTMTFANSKNKLVAWAAPRPEAQAMIANDESLANYRTTLQLVENKLLLNVYTREISMLVVATLQWGYGDLFHCWINGNGWTKC